MQKYAPVAPVPSRPLWVIVLSGGLIAGVTMGMRQVMGLYLPPMTMELGIGREPFSNAMAIANLIWGIGAVLVSSRRAHREGDRQESDRLRSSCAGPAHARLPDT